jgi:hypothetical protein
MPRICVACLNNLAEPGQIRCPDCQPKPVGPPRAHLELPPVAAGPATSREAIRARRRACAAKT